MLPPFQRIAPLLLRVRWVENLVVAPLIDRPAVLATVRGAAPLMVPPLRLPVALIVRASVPLRVPPEWLYVGTPSGSPRLRLAPPPVMAGAVRRVLSVAAGLNVTSAPLKVVLPPALYAPSNVTVP